MFNRSLVTVMNSKILYFDYIGVKLSYFCKSRQVFMHLSTLFLNIRIGKPMRLNGQFKLY